MFFKLVCNRPLSKLVSGSELVGVSNTQNRSVLNIDEDSSIKTTPQDAAETSFERGLLSKINRLLHNFYKDIVKINEV